MEQKPFFSVIIPSYNRAKFVVKTIRSILEQQYSSFEIVLVDDGSSDQTETVVKALNEPALKYYRTENRERAAARNYGISKAQGAYMVFIDSDDSMYPHCLQLAFNFIEENKRPELFHLAHEVRDSKNNLIETTINIKNINTLLIKGNPLACINVVVRKDIIEQFKFHEDRRMAGFEDWELWLRLAAHYPILQVKTVSGLMLEHAQRSSNNQTDRDKLIQRVNLFMQTVLSNTDITRVYKQQLHLFRSACYTYIALHLALSKKHKKEVFVYLLKGLRENPRFMFERRFAAIIKHVLI